MKNRLLGERYKLDKPIGEGGMGVVYRALDTVTGETVAVKIIRDTIACEVRAVKRFLREAEAAGRLNHPGIVRVFDEGSDIEHYLVMEYVDGVTIREWVRTYGRNWRPIVVLLGEILGALYHAHSRGIIHRDIKPENILITRDRHAKLMDFGLARPMASPGATITQSGAIVGTVAYMSPEQAAGKRGDERSDIYSLGVVAYELLTGKRPFSGDNAMETLLKHIQEDPLPPRRHNPGLPQALEDVILRLLAKKPDERYTNAASAWEALHAVVQAPEPRGRAASPTARPAAAAQPPPTAEVPRKPPMRPAAVAALQQLQGRATRKTAAEQPEPVELTVLYTEVEKLNQVLEDRHPLEHAEHLGLYVRTVDSVANITRGRILERKGTKQILVFDGTRMENPAAHAVRAMIRLKEEVDELALRSGSGEHPRPDFFLSAGIYTSRVRPPSEGSIDDTVREEMLNSAKLLHSMSATDRRWCVACEQTTRKLSGEVDCNPVKKIFLAGKNRPIQVYELKERAE
ncbi:MAG: hypothetical protein FJX76_11775 [Armatimonadetes bacterium]|nr:hypothetical protein [Armatimonadota bacterium]